MSLDSQGTTLPEYIDFLLSPEIPLDFHVYVGNPDVKTQEKIGAVKWMLIARSKVLRVMLLKSKMRHEKEMSITDLEPDTFKNFLVFLYGHDNTSSLQLEAAVSLLCAAEKYDVEDLKSRLDDVITPQVTVDNVFVVLQNALVCENAPKLWETVNEIIQYRTEQVFSHTEFPKVSPEVLLHIVQQESLSVPEIDVWRAALNWATHQAQPVEGVMSAENLRLTIFPFLKSIRLCTLSTEHLVKEVQVTQILTSEEMRDISLLMAGIKLSDSSDLICMETEERGRISLLSDKRIKTFTQQGLSVAQNCKLTGDGIYILTKNSSIELCAVECRTCEIPSVKMTPKKRTQEYKVTVKIKHIPHEGVNSTYPEPEHPPLEINYVEQLEYDTDFVIPLEHDYKNVILKPNNLYAIEFTSNNEVQLWYSATNGDSYQVTESFDIKFLHPGNCTNCFSPIKNLYYKEHDLQ